MFSARVSAPSPADVAHPLIPADSTGSAAFGGCLSVSRPEPCEGCGDPKGAALALRPPRSRSTAPPGCVPAPFPSVGLSRSSTSRPCSSGRAPVLRLVPAGRGSLGGVAHSVIGAPGARPVIRRPRRSGPPGDGVRNRSIKATWRSRWGQSQLGHNDLVTPLPAAAGRNHRHSYNIAPDPNLHPVSTNEDDCNRNVTRSRKGLTEICCVPILAPSTRPDPLQRLHGSTSNAARM
jgi:hypothetical protein